MDTTLTEPNPTNRKPMWMLIAGFSSVLVANGFLVYFAINTWTGLETEQHYAKGLAYNETIEAAKRQQSLGWRIETETNFVNGEGVAGVTQARFSETDGQPLTTLEIRILAKRPTHEGFDTEFPLRHMGQGRYRGEFTLPLKGQWDFHLVAQRGEDNFQRVERIVTP